MTAQDMQNIVYDRIFVGGGLASLFAAYATLKAAHDAKKNIAILVITDRIKAPVTAGSHWVQQAEGMMAGPDAVENFDSIRALLANARDALIETVAKESIACRFQAGYEVKSKSADALENFVRKASANGVFKTQEATGNSNEQTFRLPGYAHSLSVNSIGQVNTPELLNGIVGAIKKMGGHVVTETTYHSHKRSEEGCTIITDKGTFISRNNPFMATGALHAPKLEGFNVKGNISYTAALVFGPLDTEDARVIADGPMAVCDVNVDDDVFWGGIDPQNMLTVGQGDLESADELPALENKLKAIAENILPGVSQKYPYTLSAGPLFTAANALPVVGRMKNYDVATGWAGLGIVPGFAAALAFARWYVHGDDRELKILESMQPERFQ